MLNVFFFAALCPDPPTRVRGVLAVPSTLPLFILSPLPLTPGFPQLPHTFLFSSPQNPILCPALSKPPSPQASLLPVSLLDPVPSTLHYSMFQVSLEVIPNWLGPLQNLLHIRAVGTNSTLHYVWSSLGPLAVVMVATNTPHSTLSVNWSLLLSPEPDGGLMVLPKDSIQFSSALVFTRVRRLGENQGEECRGESSSQLEGGTKDWGWVK